MFTKKVGSSSEFFLLSVDILSKIYQNFRNILTKVRENFEKNLKEMFYIL